MSLIEDRKDDYSINKTTNNKHLIFIDKNTKSGAYVQAKFTTQRILNSEEGHYFGMGYSLCAELFETEHCTIAQIVGENRPIAFLNHKEAKEKFGIPESEPLYFIPFNINGDSFDNFVDDRGIDNVLDLFDTNNPFLSLTEAITNWSNTISEKSR
jgi:hypothetical protein